MRFALIKEGKADVPLVSVLTRLCRSLGAIDVAAEAVPNLGVGRKIAPNVKALLDGDPDISLLFIHMDGDQEGLALRRSRIDQALERCGRPRPYARVVPVRETEAWLLTDSRKIREVAGYPEGDTPLNLPKLALIEGCADVKTRLREALTLAQRPRKHQKRKLYSIEEKEYARLRNELLENLDIHGPVHQLPAWQALVDDTRVALAALAQS
jgi:hypothetical protein